jgi:hypothetical protein
VEVHVWIWVKSLDCLESWKFWVDKAMPAAEALCSTVSAKALNNFEFFLGKYKLF